MDKFWMVMKHSQHEPQFVTLENLPTKKHKNRSEAEKEAQRLATKQPGNKFIVLEAMDYCSSCEVVWGDCVIKEKEYEQRSWMDLTKKEQGIPFRG